MPAPPFPYGGNGTNYGLLGDFGGSPLFNLGVGLLAQSGPSLTPQSPWQAIGRSAQYAGEQTREAREKALQNELFRAKLGESAREREGQEALFAALDSGKIALPEGVDPVLAKSLFRAAPGEAAKAYLGSVFPDPQTQAAIAASNVQTAKTLSELSAGKGETVGGATTAFSDINAIAQASRRLENADSYSATLLRPGGFIEKAGVLSLAPAVIQGLNLAGVDTADAELNAADALTIQKATSSLTTSLQTQVPSLRSNANLQNIQTAMAANTPWTAKRRQLVTSLDGLFADLKAQSFDKDLPMFNDMVKLRDQLHQDDVDFTKRFEAKRGAKGSVPSVLPPNMQPNTSTQISPQAGVPQLTPGYGAVAPPAAPQATGDELFQFAPPANAAPAPPASAAPAAPAKVPQLRYAPNGEPQFRSFSEVGRAEKNGWLAQAQATGIWVGGKHYSWQPE